MSKIFSLLLVTIVSLNSYSQKPDTLIKKLDSLSIKADSAGKQLNNTNPTAYNEQTRLTPKSYFILLGSNLKQEFTKPFHMHKKDWGKFGAFAIATIALSFADKPIQKQALKFRASNSKALNISKIITQSGGTAEVVTLSGLFAFGVIFKNQKLKTTTLLASQAYITGGAIETVLKFLTGRTRPSHYDPTAEAEPKFLGPFSSSRNYDGGRSNSSFPSGHATVAFAAATVFAMEYKSTVWVPIISYSVATLISISRITENKHWITDVFVGAVLGYLSGRQIVNNYHRYAKLKAPGQPKNSVSFNVGYLNGQLRPGLVYHIN